MPVGTAIYSRKKVFIKVKEDLVVCPREGPFLLSLKKDFVSHFFWTIAIKVSYRPLQIYPYD
jgi:hypothetical protein